MIVVPAAVPHLRERGRLVVRGEEGIPILLLWDGGRPRAVQALCPHRGAPLEDGELVEGVLVCAWHRSVFRITDGGVVAGPAEVPLRVLPVVVRDDDIVVGVR